MSTNETTTTPAADVFAGLPPIFRECVDPVRNRYSLHAPFWQAGYLYATDGRIMVRTPMAVEPTYPAAWTDPQRRVPKNIAAGIFPPDEPHDAEPSPLPDGLSTAPVACPKCKGEKVGECETCEGSGEWKCPTCDHVHDCEECDGEGRASCGKCDGEGVLYVSPEGAESVPVGRHRFDPVLLARLKAGGVTGLYLSPSNGAAAKFAVDGCEGRIMPKVSTYGDDE